MKFRYIITVYAAVWIVFIIGICIFEWNILKRFQMEYEKEQNSLSENITHTVSDDRQNTHTTAEIVSESRQKHIITADSTMTIYLNGVLHNPLHCEEIEDSVYSDISQLLGKEIKKCNYTIEKAASDIIDVKNAKGSSIMPVGSDYIKGSCSYDKNIADKAVKAFEQYLKHINGMITLEELNQVMRSGSKAYAAVQNSQQSLKWMIKSKSIQFTREDVADMRFFDDNHFSCDISIDLAKISDTEHERKVEETVNYTVLYEKVNTTWYIYSFAIK